jgi:hypothetical protein
MAVKLMVAPAIVKGVVEKREPAGRREAPAAKPKRRRSSIYDSEGTEVFITLMCLKCHKMRPLSQFGLRKMADGAIRNQPWCRPCRSVAGAAKPRGKGSAETVESAAAAAPPPPSASAKEPAAPVAGAAPGRQLASSVAAQVTEALTAGRD